MCRELSAFYWCGGISSILRFVKSFFFFQDCKCPFSMSQLCLFKEFDWFKLIAELLRHLVEWQYFLWRIGIANVLFRWCVFWEVSFLFFFSIACFNFHFSFPACGYLSMRKSFKLKLSLLLVPVEKVKPLLITASFDVLNRRLFILTSAFIDYFISLVLMWWSYSVWTVFFFFFFWCVFISTNSRWYDISIVPLIRICSVWCYAD